MQNKIRIRKQHSPAPPAPQVTVNPAKFSEIRLLRLNDHQATAPVVDRPDIVEQIWREHVVKSECFDAERESLVVFTLNTRRRLTSFQIVSQGTVDTLLARTGEILRPAVIQNSSAFIVAHNHPSGDPSPSENDIKLTRDLQRAGCLMRCDLIDHVIIGSQMHEPSCASLLEMGFLDDDATPPAAPPAGKLSAAGLPRHSFRATAGAVPKSLVLDVHDALDVIACLNSALQKSVTLTEKLDRALRRLTNDKLKQVA